MSHREAVEESVEALIEASTEYEGRLPREITIGLLGSNQAAVRVRYGADLVPLEYLQTLPDHTGEVSG